MPTFTLSSITLPKSVGQWHNMGCSATRPQLANGTNGTVKEKVGSSGTSPLNGGGTGTKNKNKFKESDEDETMDPVLAGSKGILDPRLPLNRREIFLLNKSWKGISRNMDIAGVKLFTKIFLANPELLIIFTNIKVDKNQSQNPQAYENSMELETHGEIVMNTLDEAISCFAEYDKCTQILTSIGSYHCTIRGFKGEYFFKAEEPFLEALEEVLGDRYTENIKIIYKAAIRFILETLNNGFVLGREQNIHPK